MSVKALRREKAGKVREVGEGLLKDAG